jgi:hypothetical protein
LGQYTLEIKDNNSNPWRRIFENYRIFQRAIPSLQRVTMTNTKNAVEEKLDGMAVSFDHA